ncbi:DUF3019 domain-containing protein [Algibacillus agarilyticus]|uniref:DUF3019 domain-containing protein n=1 Tax=Algibacillus agarilyticus TaxID=2234133 RepID=UPI00130033B4|nr:DUF3019 domain-containing protein [Algibacillus agarilyticus]
MYKLTLLSVLFLTSLNDISSAFANPISTQLHVTPTRCVALHQGQTCYQLIDISWEITSQGSYCLFISSTKQALNCWQQNTAQHGTYQYDVQSAKDVIISIKNMQSEQTIAQMRFEIAWVYSQSQQRRSSWRLF